MPKQPTPDFEEIFESLDENADQSSFATHFFNARQQRADMDAFKHILTRQSGQEPCEGDELVTG